LHWKTPYSGWVKCSYDGTFVWDRSSKVGWIIRNDRGSFLAAGQAQGKQTSCSLESEGHALLFSMKYCRNKGYTNVCFKGDNKEIVDILNGHKLNFAAYNWIRRECNKLADVFPKHMIPNNALYFSYDFIPLVITNDVHSNFSPYLI
ncbi:hypothetical protein CARUB_v10024549mg, partial [Capsella rubella]